MSTSQAKATELNQLFVEKGWTPSNANFKPRAFVIARRDFYDVAGFPPGKNCVSKSCQTEEEVVAFLDQEPPPDFNDIIQRDERAGLEEELAAAKAKIAEEEEAMREIDIRGTIYKFTPIDALTLMGAFIVNLARDPAEVRLASGERVTVTIDDVEHIGRQLAGKEP